MQGSRRSALHDSRRRKAVRGLFTLAALLAVFLQAFVVEPHVHTANPLATAIAANAGGHEIHQHATLPHEQIKCLVCQAIAAGAGALIASGADLAKPHITIAAAPARALHVAGQATSHSWRSRAPPFSL